LVACAPPSGELNWSGLLEVVRGQLVYLILVKKPGQVARELGKTAAPARKGSTVAAVQPGLHGSLSSVTQRFPQGLGLHGLGQ
jgi:hypothetical protein